MPADLAIRVLQDITRQQMLRAGDRVGVGLSGGSDSVALLRILQVLRSKLGIRLAVLHFNHLLRGAESDADEQFVSALAADQNLPFFAGREDVLATARARGWNLEDAGRRLRYAFFASLVDRGCVNRVAVAHTADDQAETVLARLMRGTGPGGLAAIYPVKGHVLRPLLALRRRELREYLEGLGQPWREDTSNQDTSRLRARLRHQILPVFEREQPAMVQRLGRLASMAREDEAFWSTLVSERLRALLEREGARIGISCAGLLNPLPWAGIDSPQEARFALTRRLVRAIVAELKGDCRQLSARHVEQVLHLANASSSGHRTELPGILVERSFERLWFSIAEQESGLRQDGPKATIYSHVVDMTGDSAMVTVPEIGRRFRLKVIDWHGSRSDTTLEKAVIDRDLLGSPLILRNWLRGDSFRPQGRRNAYKLKELLRASKVAVRDRPGWPVLTSGGKLVWARGLPVAAEFAAGGATRTGLLIAEEES
jgi:tRNA(Ile)-lysidine synthase